MKKFLCVGCYNEYSSRSEAESCCGEEAEEMEDEDETEEHKEMTE